MTRCLLDVNVLIALVDSAHVQHNTVPGWFAQTEKASLLSRHGRITDSCVLALAKANRGKLATLDHKPSAEVVADGKKALALITHA